MDTIGVIVGWLFGIAIVVGLARFLYSEMIIAPRDNRFAAQVSLYAADVLHEERADQLYQRIRSAGYKTQGVRELTFGEALLHALEPSDWRLFEELVAFLFRQAGWDAAATRPTQDRGIDVLGTNAKGQKFVAQVKHQQASVGQPIVQAAAGAALSEGASVVVVATSSEFTRQAKEWAANLSGPLEAQLWDKSHLSNLIDQLNDEERITLTDAVTNSRVQRRLRTVLELAPSLSNIEAHIQQAVLVRFGQLPQCWEHNQEMVIHLSGEYAPEVWWKCSVKDCPRIRDSLGEHGYFRFKDQMLDRRRRRRAPRR